MKYLLIILLLFCINCRQEPHAETKAEVITSGCIKDIEYIQGGFFDLPKIYIKFQDGHIQVVDWELSLEKSLRIGSCGKLYRRRDDSFWMGYSITWRLSNE